MQVVTGEADIDGLEAPSLSSEEVYQRLLPLPGVNPNPSTVVIRQEAVCIFVSMTHQKCAVQQPGCRGKSQHMQS